MSRFWIVLIAALGLAGILLIALHSGDDGSSQPSQAEAVSSLCSSLDELDSATTQLTQLNPSTTSVSELQAEIADVEHVWTEVESDAADVAGSASTQLDAAWQSFDTAVSGIPSTESVSTAMQTVNAAGQALLTTTQQTVGLLSCS